jgi:hypothetical protein
MTVNYSAYNDIISIHFIAGCGPSQDLPHTEEVPKTRQAPCLLCLQQPFIIWGRCQSTEMISKISPPVLCQAQTCAGSEEATQPRSLSDHSLALTLREHQWFLQTSHEVRPIFIPPFLRSEKKMKFGGMQGHTVCEGAWIQTQVA